MMDIFDVMTEEAANDANTPRSVDVSLEQARGAATSTRKFTGGTAVSPEQVRSEMEQTVARCTACERKDVK
jgi:heterodisulfide reductase subunit A-like polyferredoxin